jgi:hypothetical protein
MGETADQVKQAFGEVASDQLEQAKTVAVSVADQALSRAKQEGFSPSGAADALRDAGEKAKNVANEAVKAATSALGESGGKKSP